MSDERERLKVIITEYFSNRESINKDLHDRINDLISELSNIDTEGFRKEIISELSFRSPSAISDMPIPNTNEIKAPVFNVLEKYNRIREKDIKDKVMLLEMHIKVQELYRSIDNIFLRLEFNKRKAIELILIKKETKQTAKKELRCGYEKLNSYINDGIYTIIDRLNILQKNEFLELMNKTSFHI